MQWVAGCCSAAGDWDGIPVLCHWPPVWPCPCHLNPLSLFSAALKPPEMKCLSVWVCEMLGVVWTPPGWHWGWGVLGALWAEIRGCQVLYGPPGVGSGAAVWSPRAGTGEHWVLYDPPARIWGCQAPYGPPDRDRGVPGAVHTPTLALSDQPRRKEGSMGVLRQASAGGMLSHPDAYAFWGPGWMVLGTQGG